MRNNNKQSLLHSLINDLNYSGSKYTHRLIENQNLPKPMFTNDIKIYWYIGEFGMWSLKTNRQFITTVLALVLVTSEHDV
jgi:hypothetical protein